MLIGAAAKTETIEEQAGAAPQSGEGPGQASSGELSAAGQSPPKPVVWGLSGDGTLPAYAHHPNGAVTASPSSDHLGPNNGSGAPAAPDARKVVVLG